MFYSKKLYTAALLLLLSGISFESMAQFSIRKSSTNSSTVEILYKAPVQGQGVHPAQYFQFALQVPNPKGATLTATFTPGAPLAALASYITYQGTDYGSTTFAWSSIGIPNYANTYNFPATEVVLGTVTFSTAANAVGAIVNAIDYQKTPDGNYGGNTTAGIWTFQVDPGGTEVTDYASLFYTSAASGGVGGSAAPSTNNSGGVTNQLVALSSTPLPVELKSFTAIADKCDVLLSWTTANEKNFDRFELEHSADGRSYDQVAVIKSLHSAAGSNYSYNDMQATGTGQYRLKMVDISGEYKYSKVITVRTECSATAVNWNMYPNPSQQGGDVKLQLSNGTGLQQVKVIIADLPGRKIAEHTYDVANGNDVYTLPAGSLLPGIYTVTMLNQQGMPVGTTQKLIVR